MGDAMDALASGGIADSELAGLLGSTFAHTFSEDIRSGSSAESPYHIRDLARIAHTSAALCSDASGSLLLLWKAAQPKLKDSEPHFVLMLLNAIVRAGPDDLLTSQLFMDTVDELLV